MNKLSVKEKAFYKKLGQNIKSARTNAGITQVQLAAKLGLSQPMLAKYENGTRRIPASFLPGIAKTLKINYDQILDGRPSKK
jgi:transcriptional regulator with XRE-family HTH domain